MQLCYETFERIYKICLENQKIKQNPKDEISFIQVVGHYEFIRDGKFDMVEFLEQMEAFIEFDIYIACLTQDNLHAYLYKKMIEAKE